MKKEELINSAHEKEEKLLLSKVYDKYKMAIKNDCAVFTNFLDPKEQKLIERVFSKVDGLTLTFFGGTDEAERRIGCLSPIDITPLENDFSIAYVMVSSNDLEGLTHRDFLGAVLALGVKRETIGDIYVSQNKATIVSNSNIAEFIVRQLLSVGNKKVVPQITNQLEIDLPEKHVKNKSGTVASMRADAVISFAFLVSRGLAKEFVIKKRVKLNFELLKNCDKDLKQHDLISIAGLGRAKIVNVSGLTKKGRIKIEIERFL